MKDVGLELDGPLSGLDGVSGLADCRFSARQQLPLLFRGGGRRVDRIDQPERDIAADGFVQRPQRRSSRAARTVDADDDRRRYEWFGHGDSPGTAVSIVADG